MAIWGIAALGLNLLIGVAGQISLGHAGFMAIGSYATALLATRAGASFPVALLGAAAVTGAVGFLMGLPALRLHGHYLALASISFGAAVPEIILQWDTLTGGHAGVLVPGPALGPWELTGERQVYYLAWGAAFVLMAVASNLLRTRPGRALMVLRESDVLAQSLGINLVTYKTLAFTLSAVYAGIAGGLYAYLVGFISPFDFNLTSSIALVAMIVFGGLASVPGSMLGTAALVALLQVFSR
nr:branched-chain amino acid ABC transporter permease [Thermaerobacter sp. PB12/4term]